MSYDEHLISMAGGDGEPDAITARAERAAGALYALSSEADSGTPFAERHFIARNRYLGMADAALAAADVPALLALVREQHAKLDRVEAVHKRRQFNPVADGVHFGQTEFDHNICDYDHERWPCPTIAAITATEEGKCRR